MLSIKTEAAAYWLLLVASFLGIAVWETLRPGAQLRFSTQRRWGAHAMLLVLSAVAESALLRVTPVALAALVAGNPFGLLNRPWLPFGIRCAATLLLLDLARYGIHRAFHGVALLWRVHEVHHSDPDYDVSTAARFHPLEVLLTQGAYLVAVVVLAPPPVAVFAAELVTLGVNLFVHANVALPGRLESLLRGAVITPGLHKIHHSEEIAEQSRNFGQTFSFWDRWFGTFLGAAGRGTELTTGIKELRDSGSEGLGFALLEPFRRRTPAKQETDPAV